MEKRGHGEAGYFESGPKNGKLTTACLDSEGETSISESETSMRVPLREKRKLRKGVDIFNNATICVDRERSNR